MTIKKIAPFVVLISLTNFIFSNTAKADQLNVLGGIVSWPDKMYVATGCSRYQIDYQNSTGVELLQLAYRLTDPYGRVLAWDQQVGIKPGISGNWDSQICSYAFTNGNGPYTISVTVKDYAGTAKTMSKEIYFLTAPNAKPTPSVTSLPSPAPTVTITATPAPAQTIYVTNPSDVDLQSKYIALQAKYSTLQLKLSKICSVKPKPKGC